MKISIALPAMAPQPTGHPASLPPDPPKPTGVRQVTPAAAGARSDETRSREYTSQKDQKAAPPSAIQIKIMEILEQQAEEMDQMPGDKKPAEDQTIAGG